MKKPASVSIIGFGRFGKVLHALLKNNFQLTVFQRHQINRQSLGSNTKVASSMEDALKSEVIFLAVPIESFESIITANKALFKSNQLLIDVLSVKEHPAKVLRKHLGTRVRAILTHPLFGPDSSKNGFVGLPIMMNQFTADTGEFTFWKQFFLEKGLQVIEMSPRKHDQVIANTQALAHFVGRLLKDFGVRPSILSTPSFNQLMEVTKTVTHDRIQLFENMHHFNPQTKAMRLRLQKSFNHLMRRLAQPPT